MGDGFIQLPPDSTGKKLHTAEQTCPVNGQVHQQIISVGDPNNHNSLQRVDVEGQAYIRFAEGAPLFDSFGKMKTSNEFRLSNLTAFHDKLSASGFIDSVGTATAVHDSQQCSYVFQTGTAANEKISFTTNKIFYYLIGTGLYTLQSLRLGDIGKENVVRRWGLFNDENGLFFEHDGTECGVVIRSNVTGSVVDTRVNQVDFNIDKADGTGISDFNLDVTYANIYWFDFQFLGAGRVRFGVIDDSGQRITCHEFRNANTAPNLYMAHANLPWRIEQFNTDIAASTSELSLYNMSVLADGHYELPKNIKSASLPALVEAGLTESPIWSIRLKDLLAGQSNVGFFEPNNISLYSATSPVIFRLIRNATLVDATWDFDFDESICEGDSGATDFSGGAEVFSIIVAEKSSNSINLSEFFHYALSKEYGKKNADGSRDIYTLVLQSLGDSPTDCYPVMSWKEYYP